MSTLKKDASGRIHEQLSEQHALFEQRTLGVKEFELKVSANILEKELAGVFEFFSPVRIICDGGLNILSHPKPAINCILGNIFLKNKVSGKLNIDVGKDVRKLDQNSHSCYRVDARDSTRLVRCNSEEAMDLYYGGKSPFFCQDGVENCIFQAESMTLNHVYISIDALAKAMFSHGVNSAYLNMYLPDLYYSGVQGFDKKTGVGIIDDENLIEQSMALFAFDYNHQGEKLYMFFDDSSMPYVHDRKEWLEWYTQAGKEYPQYGFNLVIEKFKNLWGSYQIQVTVDRRGGMIPYHIEDKAKPYEIVYDITSIADTIPERVLSESEERKLLKGVKSVIIPVDLYDKIMQFIVSKSDKTIDRQFVSAYLRSENQLIRLGSTTIKEKYDLSSEQSNILIKNLYVHACFDRMVQTKEIGSSFDGRQGLWRTCYKSLITLIIFLFSLVGSFYFSDVCVQRYSRYPLINWFYYQFYDFLRPFADAVWAIRVDMSMLHDWSLIDRALYDGLLLKTDFAYYIERITRSLPLFLALPFPGVSLLLSVILNNDVIISTVMNWYDSYAYPTEVCESFLIFRAPCYLGVVSSVVMLVYLYVRCQKTGGFSFFSMLIDYRYCNMIQKNTHQLMKRKFKRGDEFGVTKLSSHEREVKHLNEREYNVLPDPCSTPGACLLEAMSIAIYNDKKIIPKRYQSHHGNIPVEGVHIEAIEEYRGDVGFTFENYQFGDGRITLRAESKHITVDNPCCEHGIGYEPLNVWNESVSMDYGIKNKLTARGASLHVPAFWTNIIKTGELKHLFNRELHVACAAPGNDLTILAEFNPSVSTYYKNKSQVERLRNRCGVFNLDLSYRNVCCNMCMKGFRLIYADVGSGNDLNRLVALQIRTLENFEKLRCDFVCKLQNFIGSLTGGVPGMHELIFTLECLDVRYTTTANPSEIIVNNLGFGDPIVFLVGSVKIVKVTLNEPKMIEPPSKEVSKTFKSIKDLGVFDASVVNWDKVIQAFLQLKTEMQKGDDEYRDLNEKVLEALDKNPVRRRIKSLRVLNTPAGGGKTTKIIEYCKKNPNCVVIAPYKRLKKEYDEHNIESYTMVAGMLVELRGKDVFLDEYYAYSPGIASYYFRIECNLILAGDPFQNSFHDENRVYDGLNVRDFYDTKCESRTSVSYSVPHDVMKFINDNFEYKAVTKSKVINSVSFHNALEDIEKYKELPIFCFAKSKKKSLTERGLNVNTVAAIQGVRVKKCILIVEGGNAIINSVPGQVIVGLTRHTDKLYIVGRHGRVNVMPLSATFGDLKIRENKLSDEFKFDVGEKFKVSRDSKPTIVETPASHHVNLSNYAGIELIGDSAIEAEEEKSRSPTAPFHMNTQRVEDPVVIEEIMSKISPSSLPFSSEIYYVQHRNMPMPDKPMTIDLSKIEVPKDLDVKRICGSLRGRPNHSRNSLQSIYTMISRYGLNKKRPIDVRNFSEDLFVAWKRFTGIGYNALTPKLLQRAVLEQARCIAEKKENQDAMVEDDVGKIKFFLKTQTKADLKEDSWIRMKPDGTTKGGQGISAQPKSINHIFGPYVRAIEMVLREKMNNKIFLGYGKNHHVLSQEISERIKSGMPVFLFQGDDVAFFNGYGGFELDISEQDRMRGHWSDLFMRRVYDLFGVPKNLVMLVEKHNVRWKLQGKEASLIVDECFQSGRADTLLSNTLVSMALFALHFKFVQGKICEVRHHEDLKVDRCVFPSFVGHIVTPEGLIIDVPRMVAKLVNRNLNDCYEEYRLAVMDWCTKITEVNYHQTVHANALKYGLTDIDVENLIGFLYSFVEGKIFNVEGNRGNCLINDYKAMTLDL
jgi:hypothetical protein